MKNDDKNMCLRFLFRFLVAIVIAIMFLSSYVFFFGNTGVHINNPTRATDYKWEPHQRKATINEGFAWVKFDADGFNNDYIPKDINILLMGSSHVEAVNVPKNENIGSLLSHSLKDTEIYNIGVSGHTIYTCVQNIKYACDYYMPSDYIILETSTVSMDVEKMSNVIAEKYPKIPSYDSGFLYFMQKKLPVVKSLFKALNDWGDSDYKPSKEVEVVDIDFFSQEYQDVLDQFLRKASKDCSVSGAKLIIFYHPITEINEIGEFIEIVDPEAVESFQKACYDNDIIFVDMTEDFENLYNEKHVLPHGFINTAVGKGHLNTDGHRVIAERLTEVIKGEE